MAGDRALVGRFRPNDAQWQATSSYSHDYTAPGPHLPHQMYTKQPRRQRLAVPQASQHQVPEPGQALFDATSSYAADYAAREMPAESKHAAVSSKESVSHPKLPLDSETTYNTTYLGKPADNGMPVMARGAAAADWTPTHAPFESSTEHRSQFTGAPAAQAR